MRKFFCLFFNLSVIVHCSFIGAQPKEESEHIVVRLATERQLIPLYVAKLSDTGSGLSPSYLRQIEEVLSFDLNHNGMTYTLPQSADKEKLASKFIIDNIRTKEVRSLGAYYIIQLEISKEKQLSATLAAVNSDSVKSVENIPLKGSINQDRRQIHQLADLIHKTLFGTDGIATTHILYSIRKKVSENPLKWISEIWEMDYDGENPRRLVSDEGYHISPAYIPPKPGHNAGSFLYVSYKPAQPKIYMASLKGGSSKRLLAVRGNQLMPSVTRAQDKVAFICDVTGNPDLFIQDFHLETGVIGKPQQIFSAKKATQGSPTFSPDGKKVAFVSNKDGSPRIYVINVPPPGTPLKEIKAKLITRYAKESSAPCWSADGSKLAYCAMTNGVRQIWMYDFDTDEERQLTQGAVNKENPTWAPNSLTLVYNTSGQEVCDLYLINCTQPNATKITSGPGEKRFPNWEPRP